MASDVVGTPVVETASSARPRIRVQNAVKSFSGRVVVDVDDLVLGERPIEGLIGPNGAGKTTLMRMIMHSTPLDRGTITLAPPAGSAVVLSDLACPRAVAPRRGQEQPGHHGLPQADHLGLDPPLGHRGPVRARRRGCSASSRSSKRHEAEIRRYLDYFGFQDPDGFAMSAGEKKLLDIVRCLLLKPTFLLLDEPTAGLPDEITEKVMDVIKEISAAGTSVVIVEHDLNVIWNLCEIVHFMAEGKVVLRGDPQSIRENHTVVESYLGEGHV